MFIKFSSKLVDVSGCYFENYEVRTYANYDKKDKYEVTGYNVGLYPTESDFGQTQYILFESFNTKEEADKRFAELQGILCQDRESQMFMMFDSIIKMQNCLLQSQKIFNAFITKTTNI